MEDDFEIIEHETVTLPKRVKQLPNGINLPNIDPCRAMDPVFELMQAQVLRLETTGPIFHAQLDTSKSGRETIYEAFSRGIPAELRQLYNCTACKRFMSQYGDLCVVQDDGSLAPLVWPVETDKLPAIYVQPIQNVLSLFADQSVGDEFKLLGEEKRTLGTPVTKAYTHMSVKLEKVQLATRNISMDSQDTNTSYVMLNRILEDNSPDVIEKVHHLLHSDQLPYATSHKPATAWLKDVSTKINSNKLTQTPRKNLITRYAREAFIGWLSSLRGGMIGYLFDLVREGQPFEIISRNWKAKADPISYLRPTADPPKGNIEVAEKLFAEMGYTPQDLERVYLTLDQVPSSAILWSPAFSQSSITPGSANTASSEPVKLFSSVLPSTNKILSDPYSDVPTQDITFRTFALKIVPTAKTLEVLPPSFLRPYFFTTGKPASKPLMAFHEENGHTASWFTWGVSDNASRASLSHTWTRVTSIVTFPHMWDHFTSPLDALDMKKAEAFRFKRHGIRFLFVLDGVRELDARQLCLFPTLLRSEFHAVRSTVERFSNNGRIEQPAGWGNIVGGVAAESGKEGVVEVGVRTEGGMVSRFRISLFE